VITHEQIVAANFVMNLVTLGMLFFNWRTTNAVCEYLKWWKKNFERNGK
jgi:hypothetical protein